MQAGNPAFGACFQGGAVCGCELQAHHLVEKFSSFGGGKPQVGGAQFSQLAPGAQPRQGELRILTGGDDQVHRWRQVLDQKGERLVHRLGLNDVVVVQDEEEMSREGSNFVEQGRQHRLGWRGLRRLEHRQHPHSNFRGKPFALRPCFAQGKRLQRRDEVSQKAGGVVVPFVQRQPRDRSPATGDPFADQRGFAKAGGGGDEGQLAALIETLVQAFDQLGAPHNLGTRLGDVEFGG